jgi:hypothetical protein
MGRQWVVLDQQEACWTLLPRDPAALHHLLQPSHWAIPIPYLLHPIGRLSPRLVGAYLTHSRRLPHAPGVCAAQVVAALLDWASRMGPGRVDRLMAATNRTGLTAPGTPLRPCPKQYPATPRAQNSTP